MAHRIVWCCLLVFGWLALRGELGTVRAALADPASRIRLMGSATLISINWLIYVWAVTHDHVVEANLGYFINPLLNVVLGVAVLKERLNRAQWLAVSLAAVGVLYLTVVSARPPWIALAIAASFGTYGLIRKVVKVESVPGLATETLLLAPFAVAFLAWCEVRLIGSSARNEMDVQAGRVRELSWMSRPAALLIGSSARNELMSRPAVQAGRVQAGREMSWMSRPAALCR